MDLRASPIQHLDTRMLGAEDWMDNAALALSGLASEFGENQP